MDRKMHEILFIRQAMAWLLVCWISPFLLQAVAVLLAELRVDRYPFPVEWEERLGDSV